jgi:hypothetical protein
MTLGCQRQHRTRVFHPHQGHAHPHHPQRVVQDLMDELGDPDWHWELLAIWDLQPQHRDPSQPINIIYLQGPLGLTDAGGAESPTAT